MCCCGTCTCRWRQNRGKQTLQIMECLTVSLKLWCIVNFNIVHFKVAGHRIYQCVLGVKRTPLICWFAKMLFAHRMGIKFNRQLTWPVSTKSQKKKEKLIFTICLQVWAHFINICISFCCARNSVKVTHEPKDNSLLLAGPHIMFLLLLLLLLLAFTEGEWTKKSWHGD